MVEAPIVKLMQETKLKLHEAAGLINHARKAMGQIKDIEVEEEDIANLSGSSVLPREVNK